MNKRGVALPVVVIVDMLTWLPISIFRYILATTHDNIYGQFSHKYSCLPTEEDRSARFLTRFNKIVT